MKGSKNWVFADGDLPPKDGGALEAHEALMIFNLGKSDATARVSFYFEDRDPVRDVTVTIPAERIRCYHLDQPFGDQKFQVPFGQYALVVESDEPVFCVFGRLDTRQPNMAYYSVQGHTFD